MTGDGCVATFDGPARAVACAVEIVEQVAAIGLDLRAGIHTGEVELRGSDIAGVGVHIASRVMSQAESGGILVSGTVKDLVVGSGIDFAPCGIFDLKGVPGEWQLFQPKVR
jgi:class 3 adenylate cyclase